MQIVSFGENMREMSKPILNSDERTDQITRMRRLIWAFAVHVCRKDPFS